MSNRKLIITIAAVMLLAALLVAGCAPQAQPTAAPTQPPEPTEAMEAPTEVMEQPTEVMEAPTDVPEPGMGGRVVVLMSEDLETFNAYLTTALITGQVNNAVIEPLAQPDASGEYQPVLAERVPSEANGDITDGGRVVSWKLRQDVVWSDGTPFTSADVLATYAAASNVDSGSVRTSAFGGIESVEALDDHTVVVTYADFNSSYLDQFQWGILPASAGDPADMLNWEFNRSPIGTGPFMFGEWVSGDHITLVRNPNYREAGKPQFDELVFQIVPSEEVRVQLMLEGDAQVMLWPGSNLREVWEGSPDVQLSSVPGIYILRMFLNLSMPGDGDPGPNPAHPILGDPKVRQAMALAIDYDAIINDLAQGRVERATSPFALGWYDCDIPGESYDPERASQLLEEAGWTDTDGDGIRENAAGEDLSLDMTGYTDFRLLEQTELVVADMLAQVGIQLNVSNEEMAVLFGSWADQAPRKVGDYDILIYDTGAGINPQQHIADYFLSANIPTDENGGVGANYTRWVDPDTDALIEEAGRTPDLADRKALYCEAAQRIQESYSQIFLYQFTEGHAFSTRLSGYQVSTWAPLTWDVEDWELSP